MVGSHTVISTIIIKSILHSVHRSGSLHVIGSKSWSSRSHEDTFLRNLSSEAADLTMCKKLRKTCTSSNRSMLGLSSTCQYVILFLSPCAVSARGCSGVLQSRWAFSRRKSLAVSAARDEICYPWDLWHNPHEVACRWHIFWDIARSLHPDIISRSLSRPIMELCMPRLIRRGKEDPQVEKEIGVNSFNLT